ncbi:Sin3 associated polypeptide p18-domain-containing protein [Hygrophoropsis aurantiaca]|uniref:Sin3 associated polypeptide p18-domain-containing protein n=1 Tax=Hygrophoropsis aurantiaca TaxID=72124 RepID=A0ACB8AHH9_9AGAM|nr:Sin3 associated polypeptide p18-domain-containing protein [Hygrophoropsis aurantiaca]
MDIAPARQPQATVPREKTAPFLIRAFVKVGTFHRLSLFEENTLPTTDEQQIFTWKDATLREVLTTLRNVAPTIPEFRHPLARYSFRAIYADAANRGRFAQKELGIVYSRDILGEPGSLEAPAPRLLEDTDNDNRELSEREKEERTLDELRFVPGDYLCVAILLPKGATTAAAGGEITIKGSATAPSANGWKSGGANRGGDGGWPGGTTAPPAGRGGGHWRGDSNPPAPGPRGRGGRVGDFAGRDRDLDRPRGSDRQAGRRDSPPHRGGWGARGGRGTRRSPSISRSRSPPRRKPSRYD